MSYVGCAGTSCITPRVASAAMAMVTARTESNHNFVAFSDKIVPLMIDKEMNLDEVLAVMKLVRGLLCKGWIMLFIRLKIFKVKSCRYFTFL